MRPRVRVSWPRFAGPTPGGPMRVHLHCHYVTVPGRRLQVVVADREHDLTWSAGHW